MSEKVWREGEIVSIAPFFCSLPPSLGGDGCVPEAVPNPGPCPASMEQRSDKNKKISISHTIYRLNVSPLELLRHTSITQV